MGMEMCCLYLGLVLLKEHSNCNYLSFALILALYPLSFSPLMIAKWRNNAKQIMVFGIVIVSAVAALAIWETFVTSYPVNKSGDILAVGFQIGFCGLSWWLGNTLIRHELNHHEISLRFQIVILALLLLTAVEGKSFLPVVFFFLLAVLALGLARWENSISGSMGIVRAFQPLLLMIGSALILLPSSLVFLVLSPDVARGILHWFSMVGDKIVRLLGLDRMPPTWGEPIDLTFSCSFKPANEEGALPPSSPPSDGTSTTQTSPIILWLVIFIIFLAVLFLVFLTVRKIAVQRRAHPTGITEVETMSTRVSLFRELADFIKRIGRKLWHSLLFILRLRYITNFRPKPEYEPVLSVRAVYRNLLHWAAQQGVFRAPSQTPLEYLKLLCQMFPQKDRELALITYTYVQARYSRGPTTSEELEASGKAWQEIKLGS